MIIDRKLYRIDRADIGYFSILVIAMFLLSLLVEIVLVVLFIAIMIIVNLLKNRLPDSIKMATTIIASVVMLVWFWGFMEGPIHWNILVSVVVAVSLVMLLLRGRLSTQDKSAEQM